jgi:hypothetical protein
MLQILVHGFPNPDIQLTISMGVLKVRHSTDYQYAGSQIQIPVPSIAWVLKSRHLTDYQHMGSQSWTVHRQSEFGKPLRCYLGSLGA